MVVTRSQSNRNNLLESETMSDNESDHSVPEVLSRAQMIEFDDGEIIDGNRDFDNNRIEQRFCDKNRQIGELTDIVLSLTEKLSSNIREGNGSNPLSTEPNSRSVTEQFD